MFVKTLFKVYLWLSLLSACYFLMIALTYLFKMNLYDKYHYLVPFYLDASLLFILVVNSLFLPILLLSDIYNHKRIIDKGVRNH